MVLDLFGPWASSAVCNVTEMVHETTELMRKGLNLRGARVLRTVVMVGLKKSGETKNITNVRFGQAVVCSSAVLWNEGQKCDGIL